MEWSGEEGGREGGRKSKNKSDLESFKTEKESR